MTAAISLSGIDIDYHGTRVLKGLSMEVEPGEFVVLLGPSGCGKSTLLGAIAGLTDICGGEIRLHGADVTDLAPKDRGIGMVFQSYALYPTLSVKENLAFGLRCARRPKAEIEARVAQISTMLQLDGLLQRKPSALSGGQRQRVAIGRALAREARVLLCDEPLSNLDAKLRSELRMELKQLHRRLRNTIVYVTHDQVEAMTLADRIAVMNGGVIEQFGTPDELYETPASAFVASFLGSPTTNVISGGLSWEGGDARFEAEEFALDVSGYGFKAAARPAGAAMLSIRPEHLSLIAGDGDGPGLAGQVEMVERTGADCHLWVRSKAGLLAVRSHGTSTLPQIGETVRLGVNLQKISLFADGDGRRL